MDAGTFYVVLAVVVYGPLGVVIAVWSVRCNNAEARYQAAESKLLQWRKARPFLKVAVCVYARSLVHEMIDAHKKLLKLGARTEDGHREELEALLNDWPSPYSPQTHSPALGGTVFFLC